MKSLENKGIVNIFPTLTADGLVNVRPVGNLQIKRIKVWDSAGRLVLDKPFSNEPFQLPNLKGMYFVDIETTKGKILKKVVRE